MFVRYGLTKVMMSKFNFIWVSIYFLSCELEHQELEIFGSEIHIIGVGKIRWYEYNTIDWEI